MASDNSWKCFLIDVTQLLSWYFVTDDLNIVNLKVKFLLQSPKELLKQAYLKIISVLFVYMIHHKILSHTAALIEGYRSFISGKKEIKKWSCNVCNLIVFKVLFYSWDVWFLWFPSFILMLVEVSSQCVSSWVSSFSSHCEDLYSVSLHYHHQQEW